MKIKLTSILFLIVFDVFGQSNNWTYNGKSLLNCDTCSFKPTQYLDDFLIDSITKEPFTGLAISKMGNYIDSCNFKDGMKNGDAITHTLNNDYISYCHYLPFGLLRNTYIKDTHYSSLLTLKTKNALYSYNISYDKRIKVKMTIKKGKVNRTIRLKFNNYAELKDYYLVNLSEDLYLLMEDLGFFEGEL